MKVLVIGATGTIGQAVANKLEDEGHDVVRASRSSDVSVDIESLDSVASVLNEQGPFDGVICAAGGGAFGSVQELDDDAYAQTIQSKLMGQVNVIRASYRNTGTVVITSGILAQKPWPGSAAFAMANGALESYVRAAALDLEDTRVNVVSPPLVRETAVAMGMGEQGPTAAAVAQVYLDALTADSGSVLHVD